MCCHGIHTSADITVPQNCSFFPLTRLLTQARSLMSIKGPVLQLVMRTGDDNITEEQRREHESGQRRPKQRKRPEAIFKKSLKPPAFPGGCTRRMKSDFQSTAHPFVQFYSSTAQLHSQQRQRKTTHAPNWKGSLRKRVPGQRYHGLPGLSPAFYIRFQNPSPAWSPELSLRGG